MARLRCYCYRGLTARRPFIFAPAIALAAVLLYVLLVLQPHAPVRRDLNILLALVAAVWAAFGLTVIALGPRDAASRWCTAMMMLMAASEFGISIADVDRAISGVQTAIRFTGFLAYPWHIVSGFLMACALTGPVSIFSGRAAQAMVVGAASIYTLGSLPRLITLLDPTVAAGIADVSRGWQGMVGRGVVVSALVGTIVVLAIGYRRASTETHRRRMGWLLGGIFPAAVAYIVTAAISVAARSRPALAAVYDRAIIVTQLVSLTVPTAFAYALVRHELFGIRLVIRRSIQYALARNALLWMLAVPVLGLAWTVWANPDVTLRGLLSAGTPHFYLLLMIGASLLMRERLLASIDRRFFRDVRDRERILIELASDIGRSESAEEAVRLAERALEASLHPSTVQVWLREQGTPMPEAFFGSETILLNDRDTGDERMRTVADVPDEPGALTVPIIDHGGRMVGALMLGSKRSEEPYTSKDRSLLRAIARQIAMVVENATLRREVGQERKIRHEVLGRLDDAAVDIMRECPRCGSCFDRGRETCPHDGAELLPTLPIERTLEGKYRLERLIGRGGMGSVYEADDLGIGRRVAVKILRANAFGNEGSMRRFRREARMLGALSHRHIVTVHDYGSLPSGGAFLVMERVEGATWRSILHQRKTIPARELEVWLSQLCDALAAAHAVGIVHRDLKPENVIVQQALGGPVIKVLDFGLAKQLEGDETEALSFLGAVMGTPGYMAPEQLAARMADHRADVFAVAVMAWEALCGTKPFQGTTSAELAISMHLGSPTAPSAIPLPVASVLLRAIAHDPELRPASISEFRAKLSDAFRASF